MNKEYLSLEKLETYKLARELASVSWKAYEGLDWTIKKIMGNPFIESTDSVAANIAEGYGRFHYLDKVKFYYNARGSLLESRHWLDLLVERNLIELSLKEKYLDLYKNLRPALNGLIKKTMENKKSLIT
ncbi:four helix bundle protein [Candidatus Parcubacteria bacterium]|nr:MAG: four helix bundle protein [Candidatus Parcubacteria bacterium]